MEELRHRVTEFALSLCPEEISKAFNHLKVRAEVRAEVYLSKNGDNFERLLKKYQSFRLMY